jgi:hypothetical protein
LFSDGEHHEEHHDDALTDGMTDESPMNFGTGIRIGTLAKATGPVASLNKAKIGKKAFKKGGEGLRGKNVTEAFRVKEKDIKRTMK